jgi:hypothetical protein
VLIEEIERLVEQGGEGGRRGEAIVAAAMDLVFPNVHLNVKANDPSRHWPGDVVALAPESTIRTNAPDEVLMLAEVKERPATEGEVLQFASNLSAVKVHRGLYVALAAGQPSMEIERLERECWKRHRVFMKVSHGASSLVTWSLILTPMPLAEALTQLAVRVHVRLRQKESLSGERDWRDFLQRQGSSAGAVIPLLGPPERKRG